MDKIVGIYKITNKLNDKVYIGQSKNIMQRFREHKSALNRNLHKNEHLQLSWNKYGENNFLFEIVKECCANELDYYEKKFINLYKSTDRNYGYNIEFGGNAKKKVSQSTKDKISLHHADVSGENNPMYHKKHSQESINKYLSHPNYVNRKIRGTDHFKCAISEDIARKIKEHFSDGHKVYYGEIRDIANLYNTSKEIVSHIKNGHAWTWL